MKAVLSILLVVIFSGCSDSNTDNSVDDNRGIYIHELVITNNNQPVTSVDKSLMISSRIILANDTNSLFSGYFETYITISCEGVDPWVVRDTQLIEVNPNSANIYLSSRSCSDLPQATVELIGIIYAADQTEVIDMASYEFNLN